MTTYTAQELIAFAKAYIAADAERMTRRPAHMPRYAWRKENPIDLPSSFHVKDTAFNTRPERCMTFDLNGNPYDLWVWSLGSRSGCIARINLRAADADQQLARFERM